MRVLFCVIFFIQVYQLNAQIQKSIFINNLDYPSSIVGKNNNIYFSVSNNKIFKKNITSNQNASLIFEGENGLKCHIVYNDYLYFSQGDKISRINITDTSNYYKKNTNVEDIIYGVYPSGLSVSNNILYYTEQKESGKVFSVNLNADFYNSEVVIDDLYYPSDITISNNIVYVSEISNDRILKFNLLDDNPNIEVLLNNVDGPFNLVINNGKLYFIEEFKYKISMINLFDNDYNTNEIINNLNGPTGFEIIDDCIYLSLSPFDGEKGNIAVGCSKGLDLDKKIDKKIFINSNGKELIINGASGLTTYSIFDIYGKKTVKKSKFDGEKIQIQNLKKGIYIIKFNNGFFQKILI